MKYEYRREDTLTNKLYNRDVQLAEARDEIQRLQERTQWLMKERDRLLSHVWSLKKTRPARNPRPIEPLNEGHARLIAAANEASGHDPKRATRRKVA